MILKWGKNTKSTKTSLLDYIWEQQAILKRKRIKLKSYESILTWKFFFVYGNHQNEWWHFRILLDGTKPLSVLQLQHQYLLQCSRMSDSFVLLPFETIEVLNYCGWFCQFFWYWWQVFLVSFRCWLLSSFRQRPW